MGNFSGWKILQWLFLDKEKNDRNSLFVSILVLVSFVVIFWQHFPSSPIWLSWADCIITILFIVETGTKIYSYGWNAYWNSHGNRFDFIIVSLSAPSLIVFLFPSSWLDVFNIALLLRALRSFRILKALRILDFFKDNLEHIMESIRRGVKITILIVIIFFICLIIISILTCAIFSNYSPEYFGNPLQSTYSIFQLFTIEGWYEIPAAICKEVDNEGFVFFVRMYFAILLFFGGIIGISFINSMIVDAMISDNGEKEREEILKKINDIQANTDKLLKHYYTGTSDIALESSEKKENNTPS